MVSKARGGFLGLKRLVRVGAALGLAGAMALGGCKKEEPPAPPPPPPRPSAPPTPDPVDVQALLQQLGTDARVQFPSEHAPTSQEFAQAVIRLANAFAKGDAAALRGMLDATGLRVLDELQGSGAWEEATARIEAVRITNLSWTEDALPSGDVTIAIQEPAAAYQLRWHLVPVGNSYVFSPLESDGTVMARAGDFDGSSGEAPQAPTSEAPAEGEQPAEGTPAPGRTETAGG